MSETVATIEVLSYLDTFATYDQLFHRIMTVGLSGFINDALSVNFCIEQFSLTPEFWDLTSKLVNLYLSLLQDK